TQLREADAISKTSLAINKIKFSKRNFRSILYNLISNAIKYRSPSRQPVIEVTTKVSGNGWLVLSVKDNGIGMAAGFEDKIFKLFRRMSNKQEGSGVGLYIVKRIVENAQGKVEVNSELDKGSEFRIYLKNDI